MTHPNDDRLLEFVLETLDEPEYSVVRAHLLECEQCRGVQRNLQVQCERLAGIDMQLDLPERPRLPVVRHQFVAEWRWVAMLAAGFMLGFLTARVSDNPPPIPVPQRLIPAQVPIPSSGYVTCRASDLRTLFK